MACSLNARMSDGGDILRMTVAGANECVDMMQAGISDPTKVERVALQKAVSIASLLLTTEAFITARSIVSVPRNAQAPAQGRDGELGLLRLDERESYALTFAKKAAAFFPSAAVPTPRARPSSARPTGPCYGRPARARPRPATPRPSDRDPPRPVPPSCPRPTRGVPRPL